ncbi:transcription termination/antitermination factor NusG, partial [Candidatus Parcubacteria bacterium]
MGLPVLASHRVPHSAVLTTGLYDQVWEGRSTVDELEKLEAQQEPEQDEVQDEATESEETPDDGRAWYVIHTYSGYENKVKKNLEQRIKAMGMQDRIFQVIVPTEEQVELKGGQRRTVQRRIFPGYVLVQMILDDESWSVVRNTPDVSGFVGMGNRPTPLAEEEVQRILERMETKSPTFKINFREGDPVQIVDG